MAEKCSYAGWNSCCYRGKIERDGKWYCGIDDPQKRIDRRAKQRADAQRIAEAEKAVIAEALAMRPWLYHQPDAAPLSQAVQRLWRLQEGEDDGE